jgi:endogenous inhibitor of DNA gyrase (YacG/DUF329 family)
VIKIITKKCPNCGVKFETWKTNKKYCSKKCMEHAKYLRKKPKKEQLTKKCSYCGREFKTTKKNKKYCSLKCYEKSKQDKSNYKKKNKRIPLGTIGKQSEFKGDFNKEQKIIKYLKKRAGLS